MEAKLVTLIVECLRVDLRFGEERADDVDVSLLWGQTHMTFALCGRSSKSRKKEQNQLFYVQGDQSRCSQPPVDAKTNLVV